MDKQELIDSLRAERFSEAILKAFENVRREDFISSELEKRAYEDFPLPIGYEQTISQPYTIAMMLSMLDLKKGQKILELGSGCGYVLALMSNIVGKKGKVYGVEIVKELADKSMINTKEYRNIQVYNKNGNLGLKEKAPFDRILISAAVEKIPESVFLQLKNNGILVAPVNSGFNGQSLITYKKTKNGLRKIKKIPGFIFVRFVE